MDDLLREFLTETGENLNIVDTQLVCFEQEPENIKILDNIFRLVHTIKGSCGFIGLPRLEALAHAAEALMANFRSGAPVTPDGVSLVLTTLDRIKALLLGLEKEGAEPKGEDRDLVARLEQMATALAPSCAPPEPPAAAQRSAQLGAPAPRAHPPTEEGSAAASSSVRVHLSILDHLMTMVSELVLTRNQLMEISRRHADSEFKTPLQRLSTVTAELQEGVLKTRMQPIGNVWHKLPRIVRDLSAELAKGIDLDMRGADTELDRQVLEHIKDPLLHMVRNAADHGIELPSQRIAAGKPERGRIRVSAWHQGGHILIEISDDGRGLDVDRIAAKAVALGLVSQADVGKLTEAHVQRFIFAPGFSTAERVTSVSGRGVGMDVVRANIDRIGGSIDVSSARGRGTAFTVRIPLTLAIAPALIVEVAADRFAIPQLAVVELVRLRGHSGVSIERIKDSTLLRLRNKLIPFVELRALLGLAAHPQDATASAFIVVMQVGGQAFGLGVDGVFDTEEIVIKPLSSVLRGIAMFSGSTILGDGSVILILDPNGIAHAIGVPETARRSEHNAGEAPAAKQQPAEAMLLFRAGSPNPKAVPLSLITRLEEIDAGRIEVSNGRPLVQYRGHLMPLVPATDEVRIKSSGAQPLLVFSDEQRCMGLVVDEIIDIVQDRLDIELASESPGLLGSAVIKGRATEIIDVSHFLPLAFPDWRSWNRTADGATRNALLIDDAPFFRNMLAPVLKAAGYAVTSVGSAREGLAALSSGRRFDVVITDIDMPGMDGFELASALRADPRTAATPVIGLSASVSSESVERGKQAGMSDHVAKFDRHGLVAALKEQAASAICARTA